MQLYASQGFLFTIIHFSIGFMDKLITVPVSNFFEKIEGEKVFSLQLT